MPSELSPKQKEALKTYGVWRPRLARGAGWAAGAGLIAGHLNKNRTFNAPAAIIAGTAGIADRMLEEHARENKLLKGLVGKGYEDIPKGEDMTKKEGGMDVSTAPVPLIERLLSQKARTSALADKQLKSLFPDGDTDCYGSGVRLGAGSRDASKVWARTAGK